MDRLIQNGHRQFLEVGPGQIMTGMMKDINRDAKIMNVQDLATLEKCRAFRAESISH
jgi:[acyl-carrier-protein] S-malonyltransferase